MNVRACALLAALAWAGTTLAQLDWAVISSGGDPDPVTAFDLASPATTKVQIGHADGNFNRGMEFLTYNSFYYFVSSDALNDPGDRGLWFWNNDVNTQLATIPFSDSTDGDATLSNDGRAFYVTLDDQDGVSGNSLYVFDNLGGTPTFNEIGETGLVDLIGLAMDPATGALYAYDGGTEALYTLSTANAAPTLVGFSGETFGAIGGMDFNADGSVLLIADGSDSLFTIDKATGLMTPAGDLGLNVSALSFRVPEPSALFLAAVAGLMALRRR